MREAALDAIATHVPGVPAFEPLVLAQIEKDRAVDVRRAAMRALKGYASDASLEALVAGLDDERTLRAAAEALGRSEHPKIIERLLDRLGVAVQAGKAKVKKGKTKKFALKVKPAALKKVKAKKKLLFKETVKAGKSKVTVYKSLKLVRKK